MASLEMLQSGPTLLYSKRLSCTPAIYNSHHVMCYKEKVSKAGSTASNHNSHHVMCSQAYAQACARLAQLKTGHERTWHIGRCMTKTTKAQE